MFHTIACNVLLNSVTFIRCCVFIFSGDAVTSSTAAILLFSKT